MNQIAIADQLISLEEAQRMMRVTLREMLKEPQYVAMLLQVLAEQGVKPCDGACSTSSTDQGCTTDTRLSYSRTVNLMRQDGDEFNFSANMPIQPQQAFTYQVPAYKLGRVIECFYFRPRMGNGGNPDDILVEIKGDDGVLWKKFRGGRHMSDGCCLLECFTDDCIGWDEGFQVTLSHTGAAGNPPLLSAAADWNYLFPGQQSKVKPGWIYPRGRCGTC